MLHLIGDPRVRGTKEDAQWAQGGHSNVKLGWGEIYFLMTDVWTIINF